MKATAIGAIKPKKAPPAPLNGVDTPTLLATIKAVAEQPALAKFQFRATSCVSGTHSRTTMYRFRGIGSEHHHIAPCEANGDHPAVLCSRNAGPTPVAWLLVALAA